MSTNERCRLSYIWIVGFLESDFSVWPVPGIDTGIFRQCKQLVPDALAQGFTVPAGEIRSSNAAIEQSVTDKYGFFCGTVKTNTSGGMSGSAQDGQRVMSERNVIPLRQVTCSRRSKPFFHHLRQRSEYLRSHTFLYRFVRPVELRTDMKGLPHEGGPETVVVVHVGTKVVPDL